MNFRSPKLTRGFTIIEIMVAVAIVGILASIAIPSYNNYIMRSRRAEARTQLLQVAQYFQRYYAANDRFDQDRAGNDIDVPDGIEVSPATGAPQYRFREIVPTTATTFNIGMEPVAGTPAADDPCGTFTLTHLGQRGIIPRAGANITAAECWR